MSNNQHHEHEHRTISDKLPAGALIFALIIILGLVFMKEPERKYVLSVEQMHQELLKHKDIIYPAQFMDILYGNDSLYRFIDLRNAHDYIKGHLKNAINIPIHKILNKEYEDIFNQDKYINVLYYSDHCGACGPWMILKQLGYKNNKVLAGGYDYVNEYIINKYSPMTGNYRNEKARYDYAKIVSETAGAGSVGAATAPKPKSTTPIKKKKKKVEEEGGC